VSVVNRFQHIRIVILAIEHHQEQAFDFFFRAEG
jgi:hypothetical protein